MQKLLLLFIWGLHIATPVPVADRYVWKYNTTAHRLLKIDEEISALPAAQRYQIFDSKYKILDEVIGKINLRIQPLVANKLLSQKERALKILKEIDWTLIENNFIVCIHTKTMSDALSPKDINFSGCQIFGSPDNIDHSTDTFYIMNCPALSCQVRLTPKAYEHIKKNQIGKYYTVDCDIAAIIYLAVGEVNGLPLKLVEMPSHNFVRWRFNESEFLNWDNNSALEYTNYDFRNGLTTTSSSKISPEEELEGHFLQDMTIDEIVGYYYSVTGIELKDQKRYREAEQFYNKSISIRQYDALALNNLSWMYLTVLEFKSENNYKVALRLSEKVDAIIPSDKNYKDTFSCACAAVGDFVRAIKLEKLAFNDSTKIAGYSKGKTCLDMNLH